MYALKNMTKSVTVADIRAINRIATLELIRNLGPVSRTELADRLGISLPNVMRIVDDLMTENLIRPSNLKEWTGGRKRDLLQFNGEAHLIIGIDLGGTKIYGAVANFNGNILHEMHFTHHQSLAEESYQMLSDAISELEAWALATGFPIKGIGIGVPGITQRKTGIISNAPSLGWYGFPLKERLSQRFAYPLAIENDVNLAVMGEFWFGTEMGEENIALIAIGTGIGAGVVINGVNHTGAHDMAGEIGYFLPDPGCLRNKYPGFGAFEQIASGTGISDRAHKLLQDRREESDLAALTAEDVFAAARQNEAWAKSILEETIDYLAQAVASIALVVDPDVILLGGGVAQSADLLIEPILKRLEGVIPIRPKLAASRLGYQAGVLGGVAQLLRSNSNYYQLQKFT